MAKLGREYQLAEEVGFFHRPVGLGGVLQGEHPVYNGTYQAPVEHGDNLPHVLLIAHEHAVDFLLLAKEQPQSKYLCLANK